MPKEVKDTIKCVVVGDGTVGKTCMLLSYANNEFPVDYVPTIFENYIAKINIGDKVYSLSLFDTAGQEAYETLRTISYAETDVFLICFNVAYPVSFKNVDNWVKEVREYAKDSKTPILLIGTKIDLRNDRETREKLAKSKERLVTKEEGDEAVKRLKLYKYVECSAKTREGLKNVFDEAIISVLRPGKGSGKSGGGGCIIL